MKVNVYLQTIEGDEIELDVQDCEPSEQQLDVAIRFNDEALRVANASKNFWVRVVSEK